MGLISLFYAPGNRADLLHRLLLSIGRPLLTHQKAPYMVVFIIHS